MTENLAGRSSLKKTVQNSQTAQAERAAVRELVKAARARGEDLTGPEGLLKTLTKTVLEAGLDEEMNDHLGYDKHAVEGRRGGNSRNGTHTKTVTTDNVGAVDIEVPRDRAGSFEPKTVRKMQRRLGDVDTVVLSLGAPPTRIARRGRRQGPDHWRDSPKHFVQGGAPCAHFAEVYGASVSKDRVSVITDRVLEDM